MVDYTEGSGKQYHVGLGPGDVGRYVLLPGDPKRCAKIAKYFDNPRLVADSREFVTYNTGVVECKDSFYGQHQPEKHPVSYELLNKWEAWLRMGCIASEMESAALFIAGAYRRVRVGSLFLVVANQERAKKGLPNAQVHDTDLAIRVAIDAIRKMIDKEGH